MRPDADEGQASDDCLQKILILDEFSLLVRDHPKVAAEALTLSLHRLRSALSTEQWRLFCYDFPRRFRETFSCVMEDACTRHSFERPRGYPGDAALIDIMYGDAEPEMSSLGRAIFAYVNQTAAPIAVRDRKKILARLINSLSEGRILSVGCGHFREGALSRAVSEGRVNLMLHDQDEQALAVAASNTGLCRARLECKSVLDWVRGRIRDRDVNLAYAAGLYDYLDDRIARRLTARLFTALAPGGRLIIPNLLPGLLDAGYMECCMNWWLNYRDERNCSPLGFC